MAIPRRSCLDTFQAVCEESPLPVVADIHFDARIAIEAAAPRRGEAAHQSRQHRRLGENRCRARRRRAGRYPHPHRRERRLARSGTGRTQRSFASREAGRLRAPVCGILRRPRLSRPGGQRKGPRCHDHGAHVPQLAEIPHIPLHIGVTEAGTTFKASSKRLRPGHPTRAGHGDTMRISLTDDPVTKCAPAGRCSARLDLRRRADQLPRRGRCQVDLMLAQGSGAAHRLSGQAGEGGRDGLRRQGPGEAADADPAWPKLFRHGQTVRKSGRRRHRRRFTGRDKGPVNEQRQHHAHERAVRAHAQGRTRPMRRSPAICCCAPASSARPLPASTRSCRWASAC